MAGASGPKIHNEARYPSPPKRTTPIVAKPAATIAAVVAQATSETPCRRSAIGLVANASATTAAAPIANTATAVPNRRPATSS